MRPIFVSYRREDAEGEAGRLFDDLVNKFGEDSVFLDVAAIQVGLDFRKVIDESVAGCGVLLSIIGKDWIDAKDEAGNRRLDDPTDFVRLETASALKRDIPVIPVLVHGAKMPRPDQLPEDLRELAFRNGVELTHARWRSDLDLLIKALGRYVEPCMEPAKELLRAEPVAQPAAPAPVPAAVVAPVPASGKTGSKSRGMIFTLVLLVVAGLAAGAWWLMRGQIAVPDLTGNTAADAQSKLKAATLTVGTETYQPDVTRQAGTVVSQSPAPSEHVSSGTAINIVLAQGQMIEVPRLAGKSLEQAESALKDAQLTVGAISRGQRPNMPPDTVVEQIPRPGRIVGPGTAIDLVVTRGGAAMSPTPGAPETTPTAQPTQPAPAAPAPRPTPPPAQQNSYLNFAGTWKMFETTMNGMTQTVSPPNSLVVTQDGSTVRIGNRDLAISGFGTLTYQTFFAGDNKSGHSVASANEADLIDTFTWKLEGSTLVLETVFDYRKQYGNHAPGKEVRTMRYRRAS